MFDSDLPVPLVCYMYVWMQVGDDTSCCSRRGSTASGWVLCLAGLTVQSWSTAPPRRVDRLLRLAGLLGGELVGRSASQGCSVGSWSANGSEDDCGLTFVYPILRYPTLSVDRPKRQLGPFSETQLLNVVLTVIHINTLFADTHMNDWFGCILQLMFLTQPIYLF